MATTTVRRRRPKEPIPVASGHFLIAAAMLGAMIVLPFSPIANWISPPEKDVTDTAGWQVGSTGKAKVTLITADYELLGCNHPDTFDGARCSHKSDTEAHAKDPSAPLDDNGTNLVQPYRTWPDNKLILIAGLWAEPNMALRLHREPSAGVDQKKLSRFVTDCELKFVGRVENVKVRWSPGQAWVQEGAAMVARPVSCSLSPE
ncbi:MAG: hypothetical protein HS104_39290 [Polyangiaceae bacterium]|nr:hypothetical protein [Polyangiaceae bacterium]MCE7894286.1 hypothetical protein [Sorangiineae bacterium PRO1]MCL4756180.1 hypothetical protein [Myxococcales bacterium]